MTDKLSEECGVIGISCPYIDSVSSMLYFGLISLQHRGQESAGIAILNSHPNTEAKDLQEKVNIVEKGNINYYKDMGLVQEVFTRPILSRLTGDLGIGHVRYSSSGDSFAHNAQPFVIRYRGGSLAISHNGNLVNSRELRRELELSGALFTTTIDSEIIAAMIAKYSYMEPICAISEALKQCKGAYAITMLIDGKLAAARDPNGLRPLVLGRIEGGYILASETVAFDVVGAEYIRDIEPGEIIIIDGDKVHSKFFQKDCNKSICSFEYVYFAMPESYIEKSNVYLSRKKAGRILYKENPTVADMVMAVPDSGIAAAIGYAEESGIPFDLGMIKNKYMGRTFIQPDQEMRELAVRLKLNILKANLKGKSVVLIDDSIVRGTTIKKLAGMLKKAGVSKVHVRVSSPPVTHPCYFGIDTPSTNELIAANHSIEEIKDIIGADSLSFISVEGLEESIEIGDNICKGCFTGRYPVSLIPK